MSAETVALALYSHWICLFGTPLTITTDQGTQFESGLFTELSRIVGAQRIRTTAYHPQANGMVERWHRTLKAALMCNSHIPWPDLLPTVLLGLRSSFKADLQASPAEMLFGTAIRLPNEFFSPMNTSTQPDQHRLTGLLRQRIRAIKAVPTSHHNKPHIFCSKALQSCKHVFKLVASVKKPLEQPYTGPYEIVRRVDDKVYIINVNGEHKAISVDLLKPAFLVNVDTQNEQESTCRSPGIEQPRLSSPQSATSLQPLPSPTDEVTGGGVDVATQPQPGSAAPRRRKQELIPHAEL